MIIKRIAEFLQNEGIAISTCEKNIGASGGILTKAIRQGTDIKTKWIENLSQAYPQLSGEWLLRGKGQMLINREEENDYRIAYLHSNKMVESQQETINKQNDLMNKYAERLLEEGK